jgi:hypothetical protein
MDRPVELIPMLCLKCSAPLPAGPHEAAWVCGLCGQGMYLDEVEGMAVLDIRYMAGADPDRPGKPFWVLEGRAELERETFKGNKDREASRFWMEARQFYVSAFDCPLDTLLSLGTGMLKQPPRLQPGPPVPFEPVMLPMASVRPAAEFILTAVEAERKDKLRRLDFTLQLSQPELWILLPGP